MARRLLLTYLTITALALMAVVVPLGRIFAVREHDRLTFAIERDAQTVVSLVEDDLENGRTLAIDTTLSAYHLSGGRILVVDERGISVADSDHSPGAPRDYSTRPEIASALDGQRTTGTRHSETLGTDLVYVAIPIASSGTVHGAVRITYPTSAIDRRVRATWLRLGLLCLVVLVLVAGVGMVFARGVSRPVRRLEHAAGLLAAGDLGVRVDEGAGPPELRSLAETFNTTAQQLELLIGSQQRFVADASHQLRTPLTALRLRLETLEHHVDEAGRPKLDAAIGETHRLGRLVQSLLVLARSDAATTTPQPVDLSTVVAGRLDAWTPVADDQDVHLEAHCERGTVVRAVPGALEQILDNLVSNALDVAAQGSRITIDVRPGAPRTELHVVDQGPGMSADDREHAFERFWRSPGSGGDGFGLGLAIVEQLARNSGGRVRLEAGPDGRGLDAIVVLTALTSSSPQLNEALIGPSVR
jgi:signal transduction histidine kinase